MGERLYVSGSELESGSKLLRVGEWLYIGGSEQEQVTQSGSNLLRVGERRWSRLLRARASHSAFESGARAGSSE